MLYREPLRRWDENINANDSTGVLLQRSDEWNINVDNSTTRRRGGEAGLLQLSWSVENYSATMVVIIVRGWYLPAYYTVVGFTRDRFVVDRSGAQRVTVGLVGGRTANGLEIIVRPQPNPAGILV